MAVDVKKIIQELVVPELREIKAEMKNVQTEIKRLDEKIDLQGARLEDKIEVQGARLEDKIDAQFKNGQLTITIPKADEVKPKEIEIKVS